MIDFSNVEKQTIRETLLQKGPFKEKLPEQLLRIFYSNKLFRLFIPKRLQGLQYALADGLQVIEQSSALDGDFGWLVQIGAGGGYFSGFFQEETAKNIVTKENFVVAGSGRTSGIAAPNPTGYVVDGKWDFCSGSTYASHFTTNCMLKGTSKFTSLIILPDQLTITPDWNAYGMASTLSHTIRAKGINVPHDMTFQLDSLQNDYGYALFYFPFEAFARASIIAVLFGCLSHLLEETERYIEKSALTKKKSKYLKNTLADTRSILADRKKVFYEATDVLWQKVVTGSQVPATDLQSFDQRIFDINGFINEKAWQLYLGVGMEACKENTPFNKVWRDITTATQHTLLKQY
ncbi:MAG: hypothetical protein OEX02_10965 [Cyclobacteriaceae bacterium]|nr:hypothetical protein [Cyclobacteriaceae bacterium]